MTDSDSFRIPKALGFMSSFHSRDCHSGSPDDKNLQRFGIWIASIPGLPFLTTPLECLFFNLFVWRRRHTSSETLWFLMHRTMDSVQHFNHEYDPIPSSESWIYELFIFVLVAGTPLSIDILDCWWNSTGWDKRCLPVLQNVETGCETHLASYLMGTEFLFLGQSGRGAILITHFHLALRLTKSAATPLFLY